MWRQPLMNIHALKAKAESCTPTQQLAIDNLGPVISSQILINKDYRNELCVSCRRGYI